MICECEESPGVFGCGLPCLCRCHELESQLGESERQNICAVMACTETVPVLCVYHLEIKSEANRLIAHQKEHIKSLKAEIEPLRTQAEKLKSALVWFTRNHEDECLCDGCETLSAPEVKP